MKEILLTIPLKVFSKAEELAIDYQQLLESARIATQRAYAPYSQFLVGAAALLDNGLIISGANQENAAYPMCLCAERVVLGTIHSQYPGQRIMALAITVHNLHKAIAQPAAPCGACRQVIHEMELRQQAAMAIILQGSEGDIYWLDSGKLLLPLGFDGSFL
ncbi:MAG TPA: cytidine deaminase [Saprospiraceae bacterium]|nr:cytidine deaminase [Saprospiraceae bacterium]HMQ85710.1 cytidine deaminase [Saprospiraceae bacterium]